MSSTNPRKRGGKRKIPILAQDAMPIYETSRSDDLSELDASISGEFMEDISPAALSSSNTILHSESVLLPILKKRTTILSHSNNESILLPNPNTQSGNTASISTSFEQEDEDEGFFNEDVSVLLGNVYSGSGRNSQERIRTRIETAKERLRLAFPLLTSQQKERYEKFKQSAFPRPAMKKWMQLFLGTSVNPNMVIIAAGMSKVFIGELIEAASGISAQWGDSNGPLLPSHIKEAYRRIINNPGNLNPKSFVRSVRKCTNF